jgi:excisionase family DNA binding protein
LLPTVSNREPDLLTVPEAAAMLGFSAEHCYRLARANKLPGAVKIGCRWRVSRPRLLEYLHGPTFGSSGGVVATVYQGAQAHNHSTPHQNR